MGCRHGGGIAGWVVATYHHSLLVDTRPDKLLEVVVRLQNLEPAAGDLLDLPLDPVGEGRGDVQLVQPLGTLSAALLDLKRPVHLNTAARN